MTLFAIIFQILSRAMAIVKLRFAQALIDIGVRISEIVKNFFRFIGIMDIGIQRIAEFVSSSTSINIMLASLNSIVSIIEDIVKGLGGALAVLQGVVLAIMQFFTNLGYMISSGSLSAFTKDATSRSGIDDF